MHHLARQSESDDSRPARHSQSQRQYIGTRRISSHFPLGSEKRDPAGGGLHRALKMNDRAVVFGSERHRMQKKMTVGQGRQSECHNPGYASFGIAVAPLAPEHTATEIQNASVLQHFAMLHAERLMVDPYPYTSPIRQDHQLRNGSRRVQLFKDSSYKRRRCGKS